MALKKTYFLALIALLLLTSCKKAETTQETEDSDQSVEMNNTAEDSISKESDIKSIAKIKEELQAKGFQTFDYVNETTKDTVLMQQYFIAFLKKGPVRIQNEEEVAQLQKEHLAHLGKMYELGYADISGPFGDDGDIRGITIYNVPNLQMADSLANSDPMVKAGRLIIEIHPWWAAKGFPLR